MSLNPHIYGRLGKSAASVAALTFRLASSETNPVPFAPTDQPRNKKRSFSTGQGGVRFCFLCPWRLDTRHLWSLPHLLCICEHAVHPQLSFPSRDWLGGNGQPACDSAESQANTGLARQTSHVRVCMEHLALPGLQGRPSVCLSDCEAAHTAGVYRCHSTKKCPLLDSFCVKNKSKCHITTTALSPG